MAAGNGMLSGVHEIQNRTPAASNTQNLHVLITAAEEGTFHEVKSNISCSDCYLITERCWIEQHHRTKALCAAGCSALAKPTRHASCPTVELLHMWKCRMRDCMFAPAQCIVRPPCGLLFEMKTAVQPGSYFPFFFFSFNA
jgi:hypothetical protein